MPPPSTRQSRKITLPILGHRQTDDYSCGPLAGWSVVQLLAPGQDFDSFYQTCAPSKTWGTSTAKLSAALRRHGVTVSVRKQLTFAEIRKSLEAGCPILLSISTLTEKFWHWVVVYGAGWNPREIYISASLPGRSHKEIVPWRTFRSHWRPLGFGLICRPNRRFQARKRPGVRRPAKCRSSMVPRVVRRKKAA